MTLIETGETESVEALTSVVRDLLASQIRSACEFKIVELYRWRTKLFRLFDCPVESSHHWLFQAVARSKTRQLITVVERHGTPMASILADGVEEAFDLKEIERGDRHPRTRTLKDKQTAKGDV